MRKSAFNDKFSWFTNMFVAILGTSLAVYAIYIAGGIEAMIAPLPPIVIALLVLAGIFALLALYNGIRMIFAPKDTRLDDLINAIRELKANSNIISNKSDNITDIVTGITLIMRAINNMSKGKKEQ